MLNFSTKCLDFIQNYAGGEINYDKINSGNLKDTFYSFGLNPHRGFYYFFVMSCLYTEYFVNSLLNEVSGKIQEQLLKITNNIRESINKLFQEQESKINKIKSENEEYKGLVNKLVNEIRELNEKYENLETELIHQNDTLITAVEEIKKMKETKKFHDINDELNILSSEVTKLKKENGESKGLVNNLVNEVELSAIIDTLKIEHNNKFLEISNLCEVRILSLIDKIKELEHKIDTIQLTSLD